MVVDSSALLALLFDEPDAELFEAALTADPVRLLSVATLLETTLVVESRLGEAGGQELDLLIKRAQISVVAVEAGQVEVAREASRRFGKGRHPAALNFGDLFAYALSRKSGEPLLYKGNDFSKTDVVAARTAPQT